MCVCGGERGVHACYDTGPYRFEAVKQKQPEFQFVYVAVRAGVERLDVNLQTQIGARFLLSSVWIFSPPAFFTVVLALEQQICSELGDVMVSDSNGRRYAQL